MTRLVVAEWNGGIGRAAIVTTGGREHLAGDRAGGVRPRERARRAAMAARRPGSSAIASTSARSRSGVELGVGHDHRGAAVAPSSAALAVWWSAVACGYGTSTAGSPYCASSKTEPPARATARSAAASARPNGMT